MSIISRDFFVTNIIELIIQSETILPGDTVIALENAWEKESNTIAKSQLAAILKNIKIAREKKYPLCQDTGIFIFNVTISKNIVINFNINDAICEALRSATETLPLRPNVVHPLTRENSLDNTGDGLPDITFNLTEGSDFEVYVYPKGAGSENMSRLTMFKPSQNREIKRFVVETVFAAGGMPCPPIIVGVGIGGSFDLAARLSKKAALRPLDGMNDFEQELCDAVNTLGIGAMGLGGDTTALAVHVNTAHCHTASLPVAVNIQCWANRRAYKKFI